MRLQFASPFIFISTNNALMIRASFHKVHQQLLRRRFCISVVPYDKSVSYVISNIVLSFCKEMRFRRQDKTLKYPLMYETC